MADVKTPGLGKVNKPTLVIAGLAAVGAAVYAYEKKKKAAAAAAVPQAAGYGYGYAYGGGYGYGGVSGVGGVGGLVSGGAVSPQYAYGGYAYGGYGYGVTGGSAPPPVPPAQIPVSNAQWVQYAQQFLVSQGYNSQLVSSALTAYIHGQNVGSGENIVNAAIAFEGDPPVAGANGYPPSINTSGTNTGQNPGGGVTGTKMAGAISNLALHANGTTGFTARWNPASNATGGYSWHVTGGGVNKSGTTKSTSASVTGLKKGQTYNFGIQALPGGPGNNEHITL
jgi:hypothetical protein